MYDPICVLAACLALGIAVASQTSCALWFWGLFCGVFLAIFLVQLARRSPLSQTGLYVLACASGAFLFAVSDLSAAIFSTPPRAPLLEVSGRVVALRPYVLDHVRGVRGKILLMSAKPLRLARGDAVAVRGRPIGLSPQRNPGVWDWDRFSRYHGIAGRIFVGRDGSVRIASRGHLRPWENWMSALRERWSACLETPADSGPEGPSQSTYLLKGMILGERVAIAPQIQASFLRTNTFHILAISGQQMALIFLILFGMLRALGVTQRVAALVSIPSVLAYALAVGWQASVARSAIMIVLVLVGLAFDRKVRPLRLLGIAALALLLFNPQELFDIGFQLSFVAVLFLVVFTPTLMRWMGPRVPKAISTVLAASLVAWLATAPITAWYFQLFTPITLLANLLIVSWVSFLTIPLGFVSLIAGSVWIALAYPFNAVNEQLTHVLIAMTKAMAAVPHGSFSVPRPWGWTLFFYYAFFAVAAAAIAAPKKRHAWLLGFAGFLTVASAIVFSHRLECVFFDVGQGDAICVRFPNGKNMLVDAGPGGFNHHFEKTLGDYMRRIGADTMDHLVMTHPHADHIGGMPGVLATMKVEELMGNGRAFPSFLYRHLLRVALERKVPLKIAQGPAPWLREGGASVDILFPDASHVRSPDRNENEHSIVLTVRYDGRAILLAGDAERKTEWALTHAAVDLHSDVLKVPHHGGNTSSSPALLDRVLGRWAIISCGTGNKFGHPTPEVLARLKERGWKIFRTDRDGAVIVRGFGPWWTLQTVASHRRAFMLV